MPENNEKKQTFAASMYDFVEMFVLAVVFVILLLTLFSAFAEWTVLP